MLANIALRLRFFISGLTQSLKCFPENEVSLTFNSLPYLEQTASDGLPERAFVFAMGADFVRL